MDWQSILNQALQIIIPALATALAGWFAYLGNKLKNAYEEKVNNATAQAVVKDVVQFVEQVYKDLHGAEKLQRAIEQVSAILQSKGINITETEINMLIESAVYGLKQGTQNSVQLVEGKVEVKERIKKDFTEIEVENVLTYVKEYLEKNYK